MDSAGEVIPTQPPTELPRSCPAPWATSVTIDTEPVNFSEVMSEQLARHLQDLDFGGPPTPTSAASSSELMVGEPPPPDECKDDLMLARLLQAEFDQQHDAFLRQEERKYNGSSKIQLSFKKFRKCSAPLEEYDARQWEGEEEDNRAWDRFEEDEKSWPTIGKSGISRQGDVITTKHDLEMSGRKNACKVMNLSSWIQTGDGGGFDMSLNNKVFNSLRERTAVAYRRQYQRRNDKKEKQTNEVAMDVNTKLLLYKLVTGGVLEVVTGCVSAGKEAHVYHAMGGQGQPAACGQEPEEEADSEDEEPSDLPPHKEIPEECAVKVFKTSMLEFRNRAQYIEEDIRFKGRMKALNTRKYIDLWAEKEMHNLNRLSKAGVPCPQVVSLKKNVLVMSFIGAGRQPAPKLKEAQLDREELKLAYNQTVAAMVAMYRDCGLVHADLSEYNLLWLDGTVFVIDLGQAVDLSHPRCLEFLYRDCTNITTFFSRKGHKSSTPRLLFTRVTDLDFPGEDGVEFLAQICHYEEKKAESLAAAKKKGPRYSAH